MNFNNKVTLIRKVNINNKINKMLLKQKKLKYCLFQLKLRNQKKVKKMLKTMQKHINKYKMNKPKIKRIKSKTKINKM